MLISTIIHAKMTYLDYLRIQTSYVYHTYSHDLKAKLLKYESQLI